MSDHTTANPEAHTDSLIAIVNEEIRRYGTRGALETIATIFQNDDEDHERQQLGEQLRRLAEAR